MNKVLPILSFLLVANIAFSQISDSLPKDFYFIQNTNAWFTSNNATGLHNFKHSHLATANVSIKKQNGKFVNYYQSDNSFKCGAETQSYYRFNDRIVFYGLVNYHNFKGKNMGGSVFINPANAPFNIVEQTDTTRGTKSKEQYNLIGALSIKTISNLYLGAKINYKTANYAKQKDLRHQNKLLDLNLSLGLSFDFDVLEFGVNYLYNRQIEELFFKSFGNTDKQFTHLIDFGTFYGRYELYDKQNSGYISGHNNKPLFTEKQGANIQIEIKLSNKILFFNEFGFYKTKGHYGIEESNSILFSIHNGNSLFYNGLLSYKQKNNLHQFAFKFYNQSLINYENIYRFSTNPGELSYIEYLGEVKTSYKQISDINMFYSLYLGTNNIVPKWTIKAQANMFNRNQNTYLFPFERRQNITNVIAYLSLSRTLFFNANYLQINAMGGFGKGFGEPFTDKVKSQSFDLSKSPRSTDFNIYAEYEFYTLERIMAGLNLKYAFALKNKIMSHVQCGYNLINAFNTKYIKSNSHHSISFSAGIDF